MRLPQRPLQRALQTRAGASGLVAGKSRRPLLRSLQTRAEPSEPATAPKTDDYAILRAYSQTKRSVVWLVKQLDSHLCDLDRRIERHIANRAKAALEGQPLLSALPVLFLVY